MNINFNSMTQCRVYAYIKDVKEDCGTSFCADKYFG